MMTPAEEGGLIHLCAICWNDPDCALTGDDEELRKLSRLDRRTWARGRVARSLIEHPKLHDKFTHPKVYAVAQLAEERRAKLSESGKIGSERRWGGHAEANGESMPSYSQPYSKSPLSEEAPPSRAKPTVRVPSADITAVREAYRSAMLDAHAVEVPPTQRLNAAARQLVLDLGVAEATRLADAWPRLDDDRLRREGYPLGWLRNDVAKVRLHLKGGGRRKWNDICDDPNDPGWDEGLS